MIRLEISQFDEFDIMQNGSIGAMCIHSFVRAYQFRDGGGVFLPFMFPVLPIVFNKKLVNHIKSRHSSLGGLSKTIDEDQAIFAGIQFQMEEMYDLTWTSIQIAFKAKMITFRSSKVFSIRETYITEYSRLPGDIQSMIRASSRIGSWFSKLEPNEISSTFNINF